MVRGCMWIVLMGCMLQPVRAQIEAPDGLRSHVAAVVQRAYETGAFQGVVVAAVDGEIVYAGAVGVDRSGRPIQLDDTFRIASVTKQLTATIALQFVEAGLLTLDAPIATYLPEVDFDKLTLRHLLMHRSGLPLMVKQDASCEDRWRVLTDWRLQFEPGTDFQYNNADYLLIGALLERVSGQRSEELFRAHLAVPLGLAGLGLDTGTLPPALIDQGPPPPGESWACYGVAGAGYATAADLMAFDRALMEGDLLGAAMRDTMWSTRSDLGYVAFGAWVYPKVLTTGRSIRVVERQGGIAGAQALNVLLPDERGYLIVLKAGGTADLTGLAYAPGFPSDLLEALFVDESP